LISQKGEQLGLVSTEQALEEAKKLGLDLMLVAAKAQPPVCKIADAGKYSYQRKKQKKKEKVTHHVKSKQVSIRFNTSSHDLRTKARQAISFLEAGDNLRLTMRLRGRENALRYKAEEKIEEFIEIIKESMAIRTETKSPKKSRQINIDIIRVKPE
jgi:translation initiation factor IF-3